MALKKPERMECLKPNSRNLQEKCLPKGCKYDSLIQKGLVNHVEDTCIIEFDCLQDLRMYDHMATGKLGHICHGAFDEWDKPFLGFPFVDRQESITYNKKVRHHQSAWLNPVVSLERLPRKYVNDTGLSSVDMKGLLKKDDKFKGSNSSKRRREEVCHERSIRPSDADSGYSSSYSDGSSSGRKNCGSKHFDWGRETENDAPKYSTSISPQHTIFRKIAEAPEGLKVKYVYVNCVSDSESVETEKKYSVDVKVDSDQFKEAKSRNGSKCIISPILVPGSNRDLHGLRLDPTHLHNHKELFLFSGNGALKLETNRDMSEDTKVKQISTSQPSLKTLSLMSAHESIMLPDPRRIHNSNVKLTPTFQCSPPTPPPIPYIIKCGSSICRDLSLCANMNQKFEMYFVLTIGRGRKLSRKVVKTVQNDDPCEISKAYAYIAASAVSSHPTTIFVPANRAVVDEILPKSQSTFLTEMAKETKKLERKKRLAATSSVHVSISQDKEEILATRDGGIEKELLHFEKRRDCDGNGAPAAKRPASIASCCVKTGSDDEPPRKKYSIHSVSNSDGSGKISYASSCGSQNISGSQIQFLGVPLPSLYTSVTQSQGTGQCVTASNEPARVFVSTSQQTVQGTCMKAVPSPTRLFIKTCSSASRMECFFKRVASKNPVEVSSVLTGGREEAGFGSNASTNLILDTQKENFETAVMVNAPKQPIIVPLLSARDKSSVAADALRPSEPLSECASIDVDEPTSKELFIVPLVNDTTRTYHQQINSQLPKSNVFPKSIPVIVHPKYLQKLKLKPNEEMKSVNSANMEMASVGSHLGEALVVGNSKKITPSSNHSIEIKNSITHGAKQSADPPHSDPNAILVPDECVSIDLTGCDDDDFVNITHKEGESIDAEDENSQGKHEDSSEPNVIARDASCMTFDDSIPSWGVICTSLPEIGFVKVEKKAEVLHLYDRAVVSEPLNFSNIGELKRFLNSRLADLSYPFRNKIALDWIVVTSGFLRVKTVPPTNPRFWLNPETAKQTQNYVRICSRKTNGSAVRKVIVVPTIVPRRTTVWLPQVMYGWASNGVKKVLPVERIATVPSASAGLPETCKPGREKLPGQFSVMDLPTAVELNENQGDSSLAKSCDIVLGVPHTFTDSKSGTANIASNCVSRTSAAHSNASVSKSPLLLAHNKQMLALPSCVNLSMVSSSPIILPVKTVVMMTKPKVIAGSSVSAQKSQPMGTSCTSAATAIGPANRTPASQATSKMLATNP